MQGMSSNSGYRHASLFSEKYDTMGKMARRKLQVEAACDSDPRKVTEYVRAFRGVFFYVFPNEKQGVPMITDLTNGVYRRPLPALNSKFLAKTAFPEQN